MRVLLVNAFASSSSRGCERYQLFRQQVLRVIKDLEKQEVTQVDIIEKTRQDLDAFLFEMHSAFVDPQAITNFDRLDFVFVAGEPNASPWTPTMRKLVLLTKMCMMTGKCFYGSGLGASLLAFLCSTAGESLRVLNNEGKGSPIDNIQTISPPPGSLMDTIPVGHCAARSTEVLLDTRTGDFFTYDRRYHTWTPHGNTGLMLHSSDHAHDYGARVNTARAGTKPVHRSELSQALYSSKRGDTKCCCRLDAMNHSLFRALTRTSTREFLVNCKSTWDLDEKINTTGDNRYRVLADSSRGPLLIEFGNCVGAHFAMDRAYPESCQLLKNFVTAKYEEFKVYEHVDRSLVTAINGSSRLKERLQLAQTKTMNFPPAIPGNHSNNNVRHEYGIDTREISAQAQPAASPTKTIASGKTSPKRCRPVSAGPYRTSSKVTTPIRTIKTSRSVYPSTTYTENVDEREEDSPTSCHRESLRASLTAGIKHLSGLVTKLAFTGQPLEADDNNATVSMDIAPMQRPSESARPHSARPAVKASQKMVEELRPEVDSPATEDSPRVPDSPPAHPPTKQTPRRIRVPQKHERDKPYCAIDRFNKLREIERAQHKGLYYSVVNDAPYLSAIERETIEQQKSKLKWMAGPFRSTVGKASTQVLPEAGIFVRERFVQENTPFYIIQRRELEARSPSRPPRSPPRRRPSSSPQRRPRPASSGPTQRRDR